MNNYDRIVITGAAGNLGCKLASHWDSRLSLRERTSFRGAKGDYQSQPPELVLLDKPDGDLSVWDERWVSRFNGVDAVVHFAGNPVAYHDWPELIGPNIDAVTNVFEAAARAGVKRFVFASSNHVMGGYQDGPPIPITESLPPRPGLRYFADGADRFSGPYAAAKLFGERLGHHYATTRCLEVIAVRIGWVWRGANVPLELPPERGEWFRQMWLSDRDFLHLMDCCLMAELSERFLIVNGMSNNRGMRWDLSHARAAIGYRPQDDVESEPPALAAGGLPFETQRTKRPRLAPAAHGMNDTLAIFMTWTTYGTWLPGDVRGWRKHKRGNQLPRPLLEEWCRKQMKGEAVLLEPHDRVTVEVACRKHCEHRGWHLFAVNVRTNHVHVVVAANQAPQTVRDQLKANCTGALRRQDKPLVAERTWTRGGDCEILDGDEEIEAAVMYVTKAQDRKDS